MPQPASAGQQRADPIGQSHAETDGIGQGQAQFGQSKYSTLNSPS